MGFEVFSPSGLFLCLAFFFAGIVDSVCGGGGLLTLPAFLSVGFPVHWIAGTNQCSTIPGGITAAVRFLRSGRIHLRTALPTVPAAMVGAYWGARLNLILPARVLELVMIVLLPIAAAVVLLNKGFGREDRSDTLSRRRLLCNSVGIGLLVGVYQGFYQAGSGMFFMLAFAVLDRLDLITASGNTKLVTLCSCITAGVTYALSGAVVWPVAAAAAVFNTAGNYIGSGLALKKGAAVIRPIFIAVLCVLLVRVVFSLIAG